MNLIAAVLLMLPGLAFATGGHSNDQPEGPLKCSNLLVGRGPSRIKSVNQLVIEDPYQQWLIWEEIANDERFVQPTYPIEFPLSLTPSRKLDVDFTKDAPLEVTKFFCPSKDRCLWVKHPYNTSSLVPFLDQPATQSMLAYLTASRSAAIAQLRGFTIKLPTNFPHGPNRAEQPNKINTDKDVASALRLADHFASLDSLIGPDEKLIILRELMTISEKQTGIGGIIRDVRPLDDGNYYLPGFAIPFVGPKIARLNGVPYLQFYENFFVALGEAKARFLLRTGLQMIEPNSQNFLLQLDRNLRPTGRVVIRDTSDSYFVETVARGLGFAEQLRTEKAAGYTLDKVIAPRWEVAVTFLGNRFAESFGRWRQAHDHAYIRFIQNELGADFIRDSELAAGSPFATLYAKLSSSEGQARLRHYRRKKLAHMAGK